MSDQEEYTKTGSSKVLDIYIYSALVNAMGMTMFLPLFLLLSLPALIAWLFLAKGSFAVRGGRLGKMLYYLAPMWVVTGSILWFVYPKWTLVVGIPYFFVIELLVLYTILFKFEYRSDKGPAIRGGQR